MAIFVLLFGTKNLTFWMCYQTLRDAKTFVGNITYIVDRYGKNRIMTDVFQSISFEDIQKVLL